MSPQFGHLDIPASAGELNVIWERSHLSPGLLRPMSMVPDPRSNSAEQLSRAVRPAVPLKALKDVMV